jgi:hypothetical protein
MLSLTSFQDERERAGFEQSSSISVRRSLVQHGRDVARDLDPMLLQVLVRPELTRDRIRARKKKRSACLVSFGPSDSSREKRQGLRTLL